MLNVFLKIFAHPICRAYVIGVKRGGVKRMSEFYFGDRFEFRNGYHGVNRIHDKKSHKTYEFVNSNHRNIKTLTDLLNDVIE